MKTTVERIVGDGFTMESLHPGGPIEPIVMKIMPATSGHARRFDLSVCQGEIELERHRDLWLARRWYERLWLWFCRAFLRRPDPSDGIVTVSEEKP